MSLSELMNMEKEDFINVNETNYEIHFNAGINHKSVSTLIEKLLMLEEKILKKNKKAKRKFSGNEKGDEEENFKINVNPSALKLYQKS